MIRSSTFFFLLLFVSAFSFSQTAYRFRNFTITSGLSQSSITTIQQDFTNALWIGTQDGLNKFDGYQFQVFNSDDTEGLESEFIKCSGKTADGRLWFGTNNGLTVYNPKTERFKTFNLGQNVALIIDDIWVSEDQNIWIASSSHGIQRFNTYSLKFEAFKRRPELQNARNIMVLSPTKVLVNTADNGLQAWNPITNSIKLLNFPSGGIYPIVNRIVRIGKERVFLATNQGVFSFYEEDNKLYESFGELRETFGRLNITDLYLEKGSWYFTSANEGLFTLQNDGTIFNSSQDIYQKHALLFNEINILFRDHAGTFWVGTQRGLSNFEAVTDGFYSVGPMTNLEKGLPNASVWCFGEDPTTEYLFIGTDNALSRYNRVRGVYQHFYRNQDDKRRGERKENSILSIHVFNANKVLVGCVDGLFELNVSPSGGYNFKPIYTDKQGGPNFSWIYSIENWRDDKFFIGTKGGVLLYDHSTGEIREFTNNPKNRAKTIASGACRVVYKDINGKVWFATSGGGLNYLNETSENIFIQPYERNDILAKYTRDNITSILHKSGDEYWLGTLGSGILMHNTSTRETKVFDKSSGLPNNVVYGILADRAGFIWLSTNKGLCKLDPETGKTVNFTEIEGLMSDEMNAGAYMSSNSGKLFFGGIYGFNFFDPESLSYSSPDVSVQFSRIKLDQEWLKPSKESNILPVPLALMKELVLDRTQRSFTVRFQASDMSNPELIQFKYILEGSNEGEIFIGTDNEIHFNSLNYGKYTLKVYARKGTGSWSKTPASLNIIVNAPFWLRWWFYVLCGILAAVLIFAYLRYRLESERLEQLRLEEKIQERTTEIRAQNKQIEIQKEQIEEERNKVLEKQRLLQIEKDKTESLLSNIIPTETLNELKIKGKAKARAYKKVSVIFSDFVGFTKISDNLKPSQVVEQLDFFFTKFDDIIEQNNIEKIKTIGDAYMAAGGVPVRNNSNPIEACLAGLQMQEFVTNHMITAKEKGEQTWELRLGINTGEVTAGVIGSKKFAYDIWGASVNKAQRMEMLGEPGKVTITGHTHQLVHSFFETTYKGKVQSKSKGLLEMYTVDRIKRELSLTERGIFPNENFKKVLDLIIYSGINYYKAERKINKLLGQKLSPTLYYHCLDHTQDVVRAAESIALQEGVTDEGLYLLKTASSYHDAGFIEEYDDNEKVGARMAEEILPQFGYTEEHIAKVKELIFVTRIPHKPKNSLEEIMCDADLDYLGRDDFHHISDRLMRELKDHGKIQYRRQWDQIQVSFFKSHKYFTATSKRLRDAKKQSNLEEIMLRLEKDEY
jgi:ligand-binding sensor domain-containing protein/class 3 adenylate cyclase/predicted metal-dependent HD superfamily phosphohydrolase